MKKYFKLILSVFILNGTLAFSSPSVNPSCYALFSSKVNPSLNQSTRERAKQYRKIILKIWDTETLKKTGDLLHQYWQETNTYKTRYKIMKDERGQNIQNIESYMSAYNIPSNLSIYYRANKDGFYEEDIKALSNRYLAPNNRTENTAGAKSVLLQVINLLISNPNSIEDANTKVLSAFQTIHEDWLKRNTWAKGSYPERADQLSAELQITNAFPLIKEFTEFMSPEDPVHQKIKEALLHQLQILNAKRIERFKDLSLEKAYLSMIEEKGFKIFLDPVLSEFFDSKIKQVKLLHKLDERAGLKDQENYYINELGIYIKNALHLNGAFSLKAPSTVPGSGARVFLIKNSAGQVVGALKIQSRKANGLDELISSLSIYNFLNLQREGVKSVGIIDYGLLDDDSYFMIIEPARSKDLDSWLITSGSDEMDKMILNESAKSTAALHHFSSDPKSITKETRQTFKGNALYDVRKLREFLKSSVLQTQVRENFIYQNVADSVKKQIEQSISNYENELEFHLEAFRPAATHGDYHGGNLFFNETNHTTTLIDYGSVTWTLAKAKQPGTGDPANDVGRMLGHLIIEDIKAKKFNELTLQRVQKFYEDYLRYSKILRGSPEELILKKSVIFYINRYFAIQASDLKGSKFNSDKMNQRELFKALFEVWKNLDLLVI